jgi:predicted nucleic acid-binding protein
MPNVVAAELRFGFKFGSRQEENERLLARFIAKQKVHVLLPDNATTDYFVAIAAHSRKKGVRLSAHDTWIAVLAEQWDAILLSFDRDFRHLDYDNLKLQFEQA